MKQAFGSLAGYMRENKIAVACRDEPTFLAVLEALRQDGIEIWRLPHDIWLMYLDNREKKPYQNWSEGLCVEAGSYSDSEHVGWCYKSWYEEEGYTVVEVSELPFFATQAPSDLNDLF